MDISITSYFYKTIKILKNVKIRSKITSIFVAQLQSTTKKRQLLQIYPNIKTVNDLLKSYIKSLNKLWSYKQKNS
jgi:hypothetical protein